MKVRGSSTPEEVKERKKAVPFRLSEDEESIMLEEGTEVRAGDVRQTAEDPYATRRRSQEKTATAPSTMQPVRPRSARKRTWCLSSGP